MFSIQDLLGSQQGQDAVNTISQQVGVDPATASSAIQAALPMLINGLATNASTPEGAQSLDNALANDHDGSLLDNLGGLGGMIFGGEASRQADAGGILGHILGGSQGQVAQTVSEKTGLGAGQVAQILMMLAPIVMAYLGKQKKEQGLDADALSGALAEQQQQAREGGFLNSMLDRDGDGSMMDDIASMAFGYLSKKS